MGPPDRPEEMSETEEKIVVDEPLVAGSVESGVVQGERKEPDSEVSVSEDVVESEMSKSTSTPRKTFDLVVPAPVSTSTRSFGATRPVSMIFSSPTSSPRRPSVSGGGTPKKWVVNLPAPLAGFSSSPSAQTRLSHRLSTRFDSQVIASQLSTRTAPPTPPLTDEESSSPQRRRGHAVSASPSRLYLKNGGNSVESTDDERMVTASPSFDAFAGGNYSQEFEEEEGEVQASSSIGKSGSSQSISSEIYGTEKNMTLEALVSPRYRPPVPTKSAALLERQREKAAAAQHGSPKPFSSSSSSSSSSSAAAAAAATYSEHQVTQRQKSARLAPPVPVKRKSAQFDRSSIQRLSASEGAPITSEDRAKLRANLAAEMLKTENFYVRSLKTIVSAYLQPMRASLSTEQPILSAEHQKALFSNVEVLLSIHTPFEMELEQTIAEWSPTTSKIGRSLISLVPFLKIYTQYINNYNKSMHIFQDAMKHKHFKKFITEASVGNELDNWPSYCIQPVQRIPKYLLILSELLKYTTEDHPDFNDLKSAYDALTTTANEINTHKRDAENLTQCAHIQGLLTYAEGVSKMQIVTQTRRYSREGTFDVFVNGIASPYNYLVLFNDALLITKSKRKHLRFDGFLLLAHTSLQAFEADDLHQHQSQPPAASSSSSLENTEDTMPNHRSMSGPIPMASASSSAALTASSGSTPPPQVSKTFSITLKSLVLNATIVVIFSSFDDFTLWKNDISMACAKSEDIILPDTYPDRIISLDANQPNSDEISSHTRKRSLSLGSSRSKRLRRLLTLGSSKSSKRDSTINTPTTDNAPDT
jgi:hypothetical protein